MNEQENNINNKQDEGKKDVITPEQTGEIVEHKIETAPTGEEVKAEIPTPEVEQKSDEVSEKSEDVAEKSEEDKEDSTEQPESSDKPADEDSDEVLQEDKQEQQEKQQEDEVEETKEVVDEVAQDEVDIEQIKKELEELKAEKEEEAKVKELVEVAQHVEVEYDRVVKGINEALRETLEQYNIPTDKTLQELTKEDPAKAEIARALIAQAKQALDFNTQQLSQVYKSKEQDVVFTKAERLFNKYDMTNEQAQVAAETFISIIQAAGLQDLDSDLQAKVELSVAQARFKVPTEATVPTKVDVPSSVKAIEKTQAEVPVVDEKVDKKSVKEEPSKKEEKPQDEPSINVSTEIQRGVAKKPVVDLSGYKEGIDGGTKAASAGEPDTSTVLHTLASLPFKERQAYLKQNFALVNKAMREVNIKSAKKRK